jgi:hypothetical protein
MTPKSERRILYENRIEIAWEGLLADVERWQDSLPEGMTIRHHLGQFGIFCEQAHDCLLKAYQDGGWKHIGKQLTFRSLVIGVLTSQWMLLRQVVSQRLTNSPYRKDLETFDQRTADYYHLLRQALPKDTREQLSPSPPLIYLGRLAELTLFSPKAPAVLSVPFGALDDDRSANAIPHEVGHAVFEQLSSFLPELKRQVLNFLADPQPNRQQAALQEIVIDWLGEIVADLVGTALAGPAFAKSALWIAASSEDMVDVADKEHPVALIRPYVHLEALKYLAKNPDFKKDHAAEIEDFEDDVAKIVGTRLNRRFESIPALTVTSLKTTRDEMVKVVKLVLKTELKVLDEKSLGEILIACCTGKPEDTGAALPEWGEISAEECQQFVLDLPDSLRLDYAMPVIPSLNICCVIPPLRPICC